MFTLIIVEILRERFGVPPAIFGGLVVYTLANTLIPGVALKLPPPAFEDLHTPGMEISEALRDARARSSDHECRASD